MDTRFFHFEALLQETLSEEIYRRYCRKEKGRHTRIQQPFDTPYKIRTCHLLLRRQLLYPGELRAHYQYADAPHTLVFINEFQFSVKYPSRFPLQYAAHMLAVDIFPVHA